MNQDMIQIRPLFCLVSGGSPLPPFTFFTSPSSPAAGAM